MSTLTEVPVGSIVAYAADPANLPSNWVVCDGTSFSTSTYADLFNAIQYANNTSGSGGSSFNIPDLRGLFIRGDDKSDSTLVAGHTHDWRTAAPHNDIQVELEKIADRCYTTLKIAGDEFISWRDEAKTCSVTGFDKESRPVNTNMFYIIKVAKSTISGAPSTTYSDLPLAAVVPFGGNDRGSPPDFPAFIRCDGSTVTKTSVQDLYNVLGTKWSSDPTPSTNLVAPDLSGKFIRGVDPTSKNDPDVANRNPAPDGTANGLGTWQAYATAANNTSVAITHYSDYSRTSIHVVGRNVVHDDGYINNQGWYGGDSETRPKNAALHFYLSSIPPATFKQDFPIGGIIAIPGDPGSYLDQAVWAPCDGTKCNRRIYAALFAVIGTTWGAPDGQSFNLPDLTGQYLRGADLHGNANGDPDRGSRFSHLPGGSSSGAGSYQNYATAMPHNTPHIDLKYPSDIEMSSLATNAGTNDSAGEPKKQRFSVGSWPNSETAPKSAVVKFFMRAL